MTATTTNNKPASKIKIPDKLFFRIGDVAELLGVKPYVLRYWESEFPIIAPKKSPTGQRVYRRSDVETVIMIKHLLYDERYSIEGARKRIKELRKEGDLRNFKSEASRTGSAERAAAPSANANANAGASGSVSASAAAEKRGAAPAESSGIRRERLEEIRGLASEILALSRSPLSRIFGA